MRRGTWFCALWMLALPAALGRADDWPQWLGPQRDAVWREANILERFPAGGPNIRWRHPVGGGFAGPAVARGRVFVLDRQVRPATPAGGSGRNAIPGSERVLCLREGDGRLLWTHEYDCPYTVSYAAGPRCTPLVEDGRVYTLGTEGDLRCLETSSGSVVWTRDLKRDFGARTPEWGFAGHPLLVGGRLITLAGGPGSLAVAFDKDTGKELWRALNAKEPGYCPPTLIRAQGRSQVVIWHPEAIAGLEPATGKVLWSVPVKSRTGLSIATPRQQGDRLFVTSFYDGSLMLRLAPAASGYRRVAAWACAMLVAVSGICWVGTQLADVVQDLAEPYARAISREAGE